MDRQQIKAELRARIRSFSALGEGAAGAAADSLQLMELIAFAERAYGVEFHRRDFAAGRLATLDKIVDLICERLGQAGAP